MTARVSSRICSHGTEDLAAAEDDASLCGRTFDASSANNTATAVTDQNAARHTPHSAKTPPTAGPINVATPHIPETRAIARGQSDSSNASRIMA